MASTLDNEVPLNAWEADVTRELNGYANLNVTMNDGRIVNEWKAVSNIRVLAVLGDAIHPEPYVYVPPAIMLLQTGELLPMAVEEGAQMEAVEPETDKTDKLVQRMKDWDKEGKQYG